VLLYAGHGSDRTNRKGISLPTALRALPYGKYCAWKRRQTEPHNSPSSFRKPPLPKNQWPYATTLKSHITIGSHLEVDLVTHNLGNQPIIIGQALHTYFRVEDVRTVRLLGLEECIYLDKVEGADRKVQKGSVNFTQETDRIYLGATQDVLIEDPLMKRQIRITKNGSASTVVWNPWIEKSAKLGDMGEEGYLHMVCVENANAAEDVITLAPGAEHHLWVRYSIL